MNKQNRTIDLSGGAQNIKDLYVYQKGQLIRNLRFLLITMVFSFLVLCSFAISFIFKQKNIDTIYVTTPQGTIWAKRDDIPNNIHRAPFELECFSGQFLRDAFAHSESNYRENFDRAFSVMNNDSANELRMQFTDEGLFDIYKRCNGVTTITIDRTQIDTESYPYLIEMSYTTHLKFLSGSGRSEDRVFKAGVQLVLETVPRCKKNPYGLMITKLKFITHEDE